MYWQYSGTNNLRRGSRLTCRFAIESFHVSSDVLVVAFDCIDSVVSAAAADVSIDSVVPAADDVSIDSVVPVVVVVVLVVVVAVVVSVAFSASVVVGGLRVDTGVFKTN